MNPEQAACTSNAVTQGNPILCCKRQAVEGKDMSGVIVATMIRSMVSFPTPAFLTAFSAAFKAMSLVASPSAANLRS